VNGGAALEEPTFSPDERLLAAHDTNTVSVWDVRSGARTNHMEFDDDVRAVRFSPDGQSLVVVRDYRTDQVPLDQRRLVETARARLSQLP
jgi:WD40 repeat protein